MSTSQNDSLRSFYSILKQTGPDCVTGKETILPGGQVRVAPQNIQIVPILQSQGYNALTHNAPSSGSGYLPINYAYNDIYPDKETGYNFVNRTCDGGFTTNVSENYHHTAHPHHPTSHPHHPTSHPHHPTSHPHHHTAHPHHTPTPY